MIPENKTVDQQTYNTQKQKNTANAVDHDHNAYLLRTDDEEIQRLNRQHQIIKDVCKGNYSAPVKEQLRKGIRVLDSGCGSGLWSVDMSMEYPYSDFIGLDRSEMFSVQISIRPVNCKFVNHDLTELLPFPEDHFDFIHQRFLVAGVREHGWPQIIGNLTRVLKPGGWIELTEPLVAEIINPGPKYAALASAMKHGFAKRGTRLSTGRELELHLINSGIINIEVIPFLFPLSGEVGKSWCKCHIIEHFYRAFKPFLLEAHPELKDPEDYSQFLKDVVQECEEFKPYMIVYRFFGQKPY